MNELYTQLFKTACKCHIYKVCIGVLTTIIVLKQYCTHMNKIRSFTLAEPDNN